MLKVVIIPLSIALGGWVFAHVQASLEVDAGHARLAIEVLREADPEANEDPVRREIRRWAVDVLEETSPVPISPSLREALETGSGFKLVTTYRCTVGSRAVVGTGSSAQVICVVPDDHPDGPGVLYSPDGTKRYMNPEVGAVALPDE